MSWQIYVDDHLMYEVSPGHKLSAAAIIGHDGNVWAQSESFPQVRIGVSEVGHIYMCGAYDIGIKLCREYL